MVEVSEALALVVLGAILGATGQGIRVVVGVKKLQSEAQAAKRKWTDEFEMKELAVSLIIGFVVGAIAGVFAAVGIVGATLTRESLLGLIAAGYAGTDFIEGFMKARLPKETLS